MTITGSTTGPPVDLPTPGPTVIGAEVTAVSDRLPHAAGGPALRAWLSGLGIAGRVLVLGPHSEALVAGLPVSTRPTWLVRSHDDSLELARTLGAEVEVLCGSFARLAGTPPFDAVIALDGVDRLYSAESVAPTWREAVRAITAILRPGGVLALGVPNPVGLEQQVAVRSTAAEAEPRPVDRDGTHPASPERLIESLVALGLPATRIWAGYPTVAQPSVLADLELLDSELARAGTLGPLLGAACAEAYAGRFVLADPTRRVRLAAQGGGGAQLASGWFVAARRQVGTVAAGAPALVVSDGRGPLALTYTLARDDDGPWRRAVREPAQVRAVGIVRRDPHVLRAAVPVGPSLRDRLLVACADGDRAPVVDLVRRWLEIASHNPFATADNVIVTAGGLRVWDASYSVSIDVTTEVATARCLRLFTRALAEDGHPHPWPESAGPDQLARQLSAAAGVVLSEATLAAARELEARLGDAVGNPALITPPGLAGVRELRASVHRLQRQADDLRAGVDWYEERLTGTEAELRLARLRAAGQLPFAHHLTSIARAGKRTVRDVLGRLGLLAWARRRLRAGRPRRREAGP